jgi:hypothetical protein
MKLSQLLTVMIFAISCGQEGSLSSSHAFHDSKVSYHLPANPSSKITAKPIDSGKEENDDSPPKSASQKTETIISIVVSLGIAGLILWEVAKAHGEVHTAFKDFEAVRDEQLELQKNIRKERDEFAKHHEELRQTLQENHEKFMIWKIAEQTRLHKAIEEANDTGEDVRYLLNQLATVDKRNPHNYHKK